MAAIRHPTPGLAAPAPSGEAGGREASLRIPRRPIVATATILALWLVYTVWTTLAGMGKFPADSHPAGAQRMNAEIVLDFPPELFHIQILQEAGRMTQVVGRSAFLLDADMNALDALARRTWVDQIKPWDGQRVVR
jgi:hypothetical protein